MLLTSTICAPVLCFSCRVEVDKTRSLTPKRMKSSSPCKNKRANGIKYFSAASDARWNENVLAAVVLLNFKSLSVAVLLPSDDCGSGVRAEAK